MADRSRGRAGRGRDQGTGLALPAGSAISSYVSVPGVALMSAGTLLYFYASSQARVCGGTQQQRASFAQPARPRLTLRACTELLRRAQPCPSCPHLLQEKKSRDLARALVPASLEGAGSRARPAPPRQAVTPCGAAHGLPAHTAPLLCVHMLQGCARLPCRRSWPSAGAWAACTPSSASSATSRRSSTRWGWGAHAHAQLCGTRAAARLPATTTNACSVGGAARGTKPYLAPHAVRAWLCPAPPGVRGGDLAQAARRGPHRVRAV